MRKNRAMRAASALLVAVLMTTCTISGTFAKYVTSADSTDTARVAKWGVTVTATVDGAFATEYDAKAPVVNDYNGDPINKTVVSSTSDNLVAPGTGGTLATTTITGQPEVAVNVKKEATLVLDGWTTDGSDVYRPIVFDVNGTKYYIGADVGGVITTVSDLITKVEAAVECDKNYQAKTNLATTDDVTVTWAWEFEGTTVPSQNDVNDTALGNRSAAGNAATIKFTLETTVTQID